MSDTRLFLDYASTTQVHPSVLSEITRVSSTYSGNPSSIHEDGRKARHLIETCREQVAGMLGLQPAEIVFTGSATESINTILKGYFFQRFPKNPHFISSRAEHHATLFPLEFLEKRGASVQWVPVDQFGKPNIANPLETGLVSLMAVNNETGAVTDPGFIHTVTSHGSFVHIDGVQALGKLDVTKWMNAGFLSFSGHKIEGPRGIGLLIVRQGMDMEPLLHGGSQERNRRSGTEATALIAGFTKALEMVLPERTERFEKVRAINRNFRDLLTSAIPGIRFNSPPDGSPWILNFTLPAIHSHPVDGEAVIMALDAEGISVSNGSACASGSFEPSHVLSAIGLSDEDARATIRISFHHLLTDPDAERFVSTLSSILKKIGSLTLS